MIRCSGCLAPPCRSGSQTRFSKRAGNRDADPTDRKIRITATDWLMSVAVIQTSREASLEKRGLTLVSLEGRSRRRAPRCARSTDRLPLASENAIRRSLAVFASALEPFGGKLIQTDLNEDDIKALRKGLKVTDKATA